MNNMIPGNKDNFKKGDNLKIKDDKNEDYLKATSKLKVMLNIKLT